MRTTMSHERLGALAVIAVGANRAKHQDLEDVINNYIQGQTEKDSVIIALSLVVKVQCANVVLFGFCSLNYPDDLLRNNIHSLIRKLCT